MPINDFVGTWSSYTLTYVLGNESGTDGGVILVVNPDGTGTVAFVGDESGSFAISSFKFIDKLLRYDWPRTDDPDDPSPDCDNWNLPATLALDGTFQASGTVCGERPGGSTPFNISGILTLSELE